MLTWPSKGPDEILDYSLDWTLRLATGETILTSTWTLVTGDIVILSNPAPSINLGVTTVWLSGGSDNNANKLLNKIVTNGGRTFEKDVQIRVRDQ